VRLVPRSLGFCRESRRWLPCSPVGDNLGERFLATAKDNATVEAVVTSTARRTYAELADRVHRLTHVLAGAGVGPGDRVGVLLRHGSEHLEALLASFALRAVPVNLNTRFSPAELEEVLVDSGARVVLHEPDRRAALGHGGDQERVYIARGAPYEAALAAAPSTPRLVPGRSGDDLYVLYTGGTTGRPRGVLWRHADLRAAALAPADVEFAGRRVLVSCPLYHGTGQWMALAALLAGGTVLLSGMVSTDPTALLDLAARERASHLVVVGDAYVRPLVEALEALPDRWSLDALTVVLSGGAPLSPSVTRRLLQRLPSTMVVDGYGATESGGHARFVAVAGTPRLQHPDPTPTFDVDHDTAILDDELTPIQPGDPTEGWLARTGPLPLGYHGDAERSAATFPTVDGVRWAIPGDRARWVGEQRVEILGRGNLTVNTGGEKVHVEEVEAVLRSHPSVADAVVVGAPDERWGESVAAVVQPVAGASPTLDELADHCRTQLAPFKVPRRLVLVATVRRSPSGKPDYRWARSTVD
jgi:acyl-CoA synthetase (AMP-forming)/AMP-acid ligase II